MSRNGWYGGGTGYQPRYLRKRSRGVNGFPQHNPALIRAESVPQYEYKEGQVRHVEPKITRPYARKEKS